LSDEKKKRPPKIVTPKGMAIYPWLNKPDTKFKPEGEYRLKLRLSEEAAAPLLEKLQPMFDAAVAEAKKNPKNKGKKLKTNDLFNKVLDDDGNETGDIDFNFKRLASGISKKDSKPWSATLDLVDAKGNKLSPEARVFGGSIVKVSFTPNPYDKPIGCGLSLRLEAVQVIKLVEGQRDYGFGDESEDDDADAPETTSDDATTTDDDAKDF
jgi:hypothetical protein